MKIISWNVNGLRAVHKRGDFDWIVKSTADIFCLQETKCEPEQLIDEVRLIPGRHSFFNASQARKGYSGVAIYSKIKPKDVKFGLGIEEFDKEGRLIEADFGDFVLFNVYFPNGGGGPERLKYKLGFYDAFLERVNYLVSKKKKVIFCGDINTAHEEIDLARPKENEKNTGFLPEERAWLDEVVASGFVDTFRFLHPHKKDAYSYWDQKTAARERNVGWRIDYFFVSKSLEKNIKAAGMMDDVYGSDHCPVFLELES